MSDGFVTTNNEQLMSLLYALLLGAFMGVFYDLFRIFRRVFPQSYATIAVQDVVFWLCSAVCVFFAVIWLTSGWLRIYYVLLVIVGFGIYLFTFGALVMLVTDFSVKTLKKLFGVLKKNVISPVTDKISCSFMSISKKTLSKINFLTKKNKIAKKS